MGEAFNARFDSEIDTQFPKGVAEPSKPSEFLLRLLGRADNSSKDSKPMHEKWSLDALYSLLPDRRQLIQSTFVRVEPLAAEIASAYKNVCHEHGFNPGRIRVYVVGGRLRDDLEPRSDIDFFLTVDDEKQGFSLMASYENKESEETTVKKMAAMGEFETVLKDITRKYELFQYDEKGIVIERTLDLHGWGESESQTRQEWAKKAKETGSGRIAVLVYKD